MGWAKIEIEFLPEMHDPSEVMQMLSDYFRHETGIPTAEINLVSVGSSKPEPASWPWPSGRAPTSVVAGADAIWAAHGPGKKIQAIKEMRIAYSIGLKEAKDYIDDAEVRAKQGRP